MEQRLTKLSLQIGDSTVSWEYPSLNCDIEELCHAFYTACIGHGFCPETVLNGMKQLAEDYNYLIKDSNEDTNI